MSGHVVVSQAIHPVLLTNHHPSSWLSVLFSQFGVLEYGSFSFCGLCVSCAGCSSSGSVPLASAFQGLGVQESANTPAEAFAFFSLPCSYDNIFMAFSFLIRKYLEDFVNCFRLKTIYIRAMYTSTKDTAHGFCYVHFEWMYRRKTLKLQRLVVGKSLWLVTLKRSNTIFILLVFSTRQEQKPWN